MGSRVIRKIIIVIKIVNLKSIIKAVNGKIMRMTVAH
jgi:hypothetical protein